MVVDITKEADMTIKRNTTNTPAKQEVRGVAQANNKSCCESSCCGKGSAKDVSPTGSKTKSIGTAQ
jgi:hypothetical protein